MSFATNPGTPFTVQLPATAPARTTPVTATAATALRMRRRRIAGKELAQGLDVHPNTITRWRNGRNGSGISAGALVDLSRFLGMSPAEWFLESAATPAIQEKLRGVLRYMESLDQGQLDRYLTLVESAATPAVGERLRRVLDYMESLDEGQLDHFLTLVERIINFAEGRFAEAGGDAGQ